MLLFPPETRALWDLVAGLRLLVGVLLSGVPLPLSLSRSPLSLSRAPEGGIASNICSILENPGAQIEADLVFQRSESSAILSNCHSFFFLKSRITIRKLCLIFIKDDYIFRLSLLSEFPEINFSFSADYLRISLKYRSHISLIDHKLLVLFNLALFLYYCSFTLTRYEHSQMFLFAQLLLSKILAENVVPRVIFGMYLWVSWNIRS